MEEMTGMDVRDALKAGEADRDRLDRRHRAQRSVARARQAQYVLRATATPSRVSGNALCAPIVPFVPEGSIEPQSSHMLTVGTIRPQRSDVRSAAHRHRAQLQHARLRDHHLHRRQWGISEGMKAVADTLNAQVERQAGRAAHPGIHTRTTRVAKLLTEISASRKGRRSTGQPHDDPASR